MVQVVHLAKGERRPRGERSIVIECEPGRRVEEIIDDAASGITMRIRSDDLEATIVSLVGKGVKKVYVRGAPNAPRP